jgi:hypothetical protein
MKEIFLREGAEAVLMAPAGLLAHDLLRDRPMEEGGRQGGHQAGVGMGPLSGITVLDLSSYIAGPYGCTLLADLGAEVVKIEAPGGDTLRKYPSTLAAESRAFLGVNRGKRGLALDLKKPEGLEVLKRLVRTPTCSVPQLPSLRCRRASASTTRR